MGKEAQEVTREVRNLVATLGKHAIIQSIKSGRFSSNDALEKEAASDEILHCLNELGVQSSELRSVTDVWSAYVWFDYVHAILNNNTIPSSFNDPLIAEWEVLRRGVDDEHPSPEELESLMKKAEMWNRLQAKRIDDNRYYLKHGEHRRPTEWNRHSEWRLEDSE